MLYKSTILGEASGSIDGITFSHNRGGRYTRRRTIPTNPNSPLQQAVRSIFSQCMARWRDSLSVAQRAAWEVYAENTVMVNALGDPTYLTGAQHYCRSNVFSKLVQGMFFDEGPTLFGLPEVTACSIAVVAPGANVSVTFDNTDDWAGQGDAFLAVFLGAPQSPTINFFKGPYKLIGGFSGAVVPPVSPQNVANGYYVFTAGQRVFARIGVCDELGRLAVPQLLTCLAS